MKIIINVNIVNEYSVSKCFSESGLSGYYEYLNECTISSMAFDLDDSTDEECFGELCLNLASNDHEFKVVADTYQH